MLQPTDSPEKKSAAGTIAILAAFALFLSTIEYMVPKPLPFLRIGLANLPVLVSLYILPVPQIFLLVLLKVVGQGLINGTLFSYIFLLSLAGSFSSGAVMVGVSRKTVFGGEGTRISLIGISILGALASNFSQIFLSSFFFFGRGAWLIGPPFMAVGLVTSLGLGIFALRFTTVSVWYKKKTQGTKGHLQRHLGKQVRTEQREARRSG